MFNPSRLEIAACFYELVYDRAKEYVADFDDQQFLRSGYDGALTRLHNADPLSYPDSGDEFQDRVEAKTSNSEQPTRNASEEIQNQLADIEGKLRDGLKNMVDSNATNNRLMNAFANLVAVLEKQEEAGERRRAADEQQNVQNAQLFSQISQQLQGYKVLLWIVLGGIAWILLMR